MTDKEILRAIDEMLKPLKDNLSELAVNTILEWADDASIQVVPLFGKKA